MALLFPFGVTSVRHGEIAVRRGPGGSRTLEPGFHLRVPFLQRVVRYPVTPVVLQAELRIVSPEGSTLKIPYEATLRVQSRGLAELDSSRGAEDLEDFLKKAVESALQRQVAGFPGGLPDEGSLERVTGDHLLFDLGTPGVRLERIDFSRSTFPSPDAPGNLPQWVREVADTNLKILLLGLDGADWQIMDPLLERGELPVLRGLMEQGAWSELKSSPPILSPLLWTTVATGRSPEEHGIVDFLIRDPVRKTRFPISSNFRKVKAFWNLFSEAGRSVDVVAWWATWPAERISGRMITDRVAYSLFGYQSTEEDREGATFPPSLRAEIDPLLVDPEAIPYEEIIRFVSISRDEYGEAREEVQRDPKKAYRNPINHLARVLASTRTYSSVARELLRRDQPDLFALYFQGIDEVCHRFAHFMPPKMEMVSEGDFRKFRSTVEEFYRYQDEVLGEILAEIEEDTVIMVLSDHGFRNGPDRPRDGPADIEGKPAKWHRLYGVWILSGPPVRPGRINSVTLFDIAPTLFYLAGFPLSEEMNGKPILAALREDFRARHPVLRVSTYEEEAGERSRPALARSAMDEEMLEKLRSLGYIGPAEGETPVVVPEGAEPGTTVTYHSNLASVYLQKGDYLRAEEELHKALGIYSRYIHALQMLIQVKVHEKEWDEALDLCRRVLSMDRDFEKTLFHQLARIHQGRGSIEEGLRVLGRLREKFPDANEVHTAIGILELARNRSAQAEPHFRTALEISPAAPEPMTHLFQLLKERGEILRLRGPLERALERQPGSVLHHNWMGLIRQAEGDLRGAEEEFRLALGLDPGFAGTPANLGALYGRIGRLAEAEEILRKAVREHPGNIEARVNLGAVLGKLGKSLEAAQHLEEAVNLGYRTPDLYTAMGRAYFDAGDLPKAIQALKESLAMNPQQPEVEEILRGLEGHS